MQARGAGRVAAFACSSKIRLGVLGVLGVLGALGVPGMLGVLGVQNIQLWGNIPGKSTVFQLKMNKN